MSFTRNLIFAVSFMMAAHAAVAQESDSQPSDRAGMGYLGLKVGYLKLDDFYSQVYESEGSISYGVDGAYLHRITDGGLAFGVVGSWSQSSFDGLDADITTDYSLYGGGPAIGYLNDQNGGNNLLYLGYEFLQGSGDLNGDGCIVDNVDLCSPWREQIRDADGLGGAITAGYLFQPDDSNWAAGINVRSLQTDGQDNPFEVSLTAGIAF